MGGFVATPQWRVEDCVGAAYAAGCGARWQAAEDRPGMRQPWLPRRKFASHEVLQKATPNAGHRALARLDPHLESPSDEDLIADRVSAAAAGPAYDAAARASILQDNLHNQVPIARTVEVDSAGPVVGLAGNHSSFAVASVWCGDCSSMEAKPKKSPWPGSSSLR